MPPIRHRSRAAAVRSVATDRDVIRHRVEARGLRRKIEEARDRGQKRRVRRLVKLYLRSFSGRVNAVKEAALRVRPGMTPDEMLAAARQLNVWRRCDEPVRYGWRPKRDGGERPVVRFGLMNQARQVLVREALSAAVELPPCAYDVRGRGHHAACGRIQDNLQRIYRWVVVADVARCFESFDGEGVARALSPVMPKEVARNVLVCDRLNLVPERTTCDRSSACSYGGSMRSRPVGLPQGSRVSNLVASVLLSSLGESLPDDTTLVLYRDDILVMTRTKREADAVDLALFRALNGHAAGRLSLKYCDVRRASDGFEFLGYHFRRRYGIATGVPAERNRLKVHRRAMLALVDDLENERWEPEAFKEVYRRWLPAFPLWEIGDALVEPDIDRARRLLRMFSPVPPPRIRRRALMAGSSVGD